MIQMDANSRKLGKERREIGDELNLNKTGWRNISLQNWLMQMCDILPLVVMHEPFYFVKANPGHPDFLFHILLI